MIYVDSQETACFPGAATNAIDGNPATFWHTQFCGATPPLPHEIQIDLGSYYTLSAFQYLPRQDGSACGWINQYEFYVSTDGVNWGTPVAAGNFDYTGYTAQCPGPGAGVPTPRQIAFPAATGRYIRLRALSEINGNPWTSAAEIDVVGTAAVLPPETVSQLTLNPATVVAGSVSSASVALTAPVLASGIVVTLSSSNPAVAAVPASLAMPPGASSGEFLISTSMVSAATPVTINASYGGITESAILTVTPGALIPQTGWAVIYVDSQQTGCFNGAATNAIDGNPATFWHTQFCGASPPLPHEIQIDLGTAYTLSAFQYLPRQDGSACGWISQYQFYVSPDGINWGTPVAAGTFEYIGYVMQCPGPGAGVPTPRQIAFPAATGRYIRLRALSEVNGNPWTSAAEIDVLGIQLAPLALMFSPTSVPGGSAATGTVTLASPAPAGGAVVALISTNPALATVPVSVTIPEGTASASFLASTTAVSASTTVDILASYGGVTQSSTLALSPLGLIPQNGWAVIYVDSQEISCYNGAATNAIDGNPATFWHTQFCGGAPPVPHEIQIDLGAYYTLSAFQYLPRQDGSACGWIHQYEFYVSSDGVYWNTPVAAGNFDYTGYAAQCPGPGAGVPTPRQIGFPVTIARYIRLRALSEVNGNPWTSAAEIDALGDLLPGLFPSAGGLDFPDQLLNTSSAPLPLVLTNVGLSAVGITGIGAFGDFIQTNNCATSLPALASCTINVTFTPTVLGYRSARLTVLNSATGQLEIPLSGNGVMPIMSLSSASAVFGPQLLNTTGRAPSIFVSNGGSGPLLVSNVTVAGDFGQANDCAVGVDVSAGCTLQVFFTPTALGTHSGTITIFDNTAAGSHSISMSGVGVAMHNLNLSWTASTSPVIGYFVYRATQSGGPYTELNPVPQPQTTFIDSLPGGATYYYVVTAVNASLVESVTTPEVAATIPQP
ncbi:MAG: discoidin domain-containing protein [Terriglobales bacterium]